MIFSKIKKYFSFLHKTRFIHFFLVGLTGLFINLTLTATFAELVFGRQDYFYAYLIGLFSNLTYNFVLHSIITFKKKTKKALRFSGFIAYNLIMSVFQAYLVDLFVSIVGVDFYLLVITFVIGSLFVVNFLVSKFFLFKFE